MNDYLRDPRFSGMKEFDHRIWLASPTMHGEELKYITEAYDTNWMSTLGRNIDVIEEQVAESVGVKYAVALASGTAALHLAVKLAGEQLYGRSDLTFGTLYGHRVFCSDMTFDASVNPIAYEDGEAVFIDTERDTWNMDPAALEKAFECFPDVRLIVVAHLYGTPGKMEEIRNLASAHQALIIEDAAESLGAKYLIHDNWVETGALGDYNCISFNGNKIITGSSGGMFLTNSEKDAAKIRKWSTQSRDNAPWYQHTEIGYNYRMSNVIAGVVRGQLPHLKEHISKKKTIYERYKSGFSDLPVSMNPYDADRTEPNFWLSCLLINEDAMCMQSRSDSIASFNSEPGKSCPTEILQALSCFQAEGRPIWKPMHLQPIYQNNSFVHMGSDVGADIFRRGLCLPSDIKMTPDEQDIIIDIIHRCFL